MIMSKRTANAKHEHEYVLAGLSGATEGPKVLCLCGALDPDRPMTECPECGGPADMFGCLDVECHPATLNDLIAAIF
jgi:hypothetical protein